MKLHLLSLTLITLFVPSNICCMDQSDELPDQKVVVQGKDILVYTPHENNNNTKTFIDEDIDINNTSSNIPSPLMYAAQHQKTAAAIKVLLKYGANINQVHEANKWTALHYACYYGFPEVIETLVMEGASVNALNKFNQTPLHVAIVGSNASENIEALLKAAQKRKQLAMQNNS